MKKVLKGEIFKIKASKVYVKTISHYHLISRLDNKQKKT